MAESRQKRRPRGEELIVDLIMKTSRTPAIILALLLIALGAYLISSASQLPERVATHFDGVGRPNGWMSQSVT